MEKRDTKQVILDEALELFATRGYKGVTVADIAQAVGIKAASLYKHYSSKQQIFDSLLARAAAGYTQMTTQLGLDGQDFTRDVDHFATMGTETLIQAGEAFFHFYLHDETTCKIRRMLTIEQYKDPTASQLFVGQYIDAALAYQSGVFTAFIATGKMKQVDPDIAAAHFYAPLYLMLCLCDNCPEREEEALHLIKRHIKQFAKLYMVEGEG